MHLLLLDIESIHVTSVDLLDALLRMAEDRRLPPPDLSACQHRGLSISFPRDDDVLKLVVVLTGTADNDDAQWLEEQLDTVKEHIHMYRTLVVDVQNMPFCYSQCVKALLQFSTTRPCVDVCHLQFLGSTALWQQTTLRAMVSFSPNCSFETKEKFGSVMYEGL